MHAVNLANGDCSASAVCEGLIAVVVEVNDVADRLAEVAEALRQSQIATVAALSTGEPLPRPDLLLLSYTGCFTFMKWFELIRQKYDCETVMLHVPYQGEGKVTQSMRDYVVKQLKENVIPTLEKVSGVKFDIDRLRENLKKSIKAEGNLVRVLQMAKAKPSPIDAYFGGIYYIGPIFSAFRGTTEATQFYATLREQYVDLFANNPAYGAVASIITPGRMARKVTNRLAAGTGNKVGDGVSNVALGGDEPRPARSRTIALR